MDIKLNITEDDLFNYVFNPQKLDYDKISHIEENKHLFTEELSLLTELKKINLSELDHENSLINKLIIFTPAKHYSKEYSTPLNLAAATVELKQHDLAHSFIDLEKNYLIRIVEKEDRDLLYLITEKELPDLVRIKIYPSEKEYTIRNNVQPIEILKEKFIEKIIIH